MSNVCVEQHFNGSTTTQLCRGLINQNGKRQCSRKAKAEFGNLCGLHYNKKLRYGTIETIDDACCKKTKPFVLKKRQESILINNISKNNCKNNNCENENNYENNIYQIIFKGLTELLLNTQTNIVYKEVFDGLIEIGKYNIIDNTINNLVY
jgi:hypothetical protein